MASLWNSIARTPPGEALPRNLLFATMILLLAAAPPSGAADEPDDTPGGEAFAEEMVRIPAGSFDMGSPPDEPGRLDDEVLHRVTLSRPFYLGRTEVTWSLWNKVRDWALTNGYTDLSRGNNGYRGTDEEDHPVTTVSWWDAIRWCNARSEMEGRVPVYYSREDFAPESVIRTGMPPDVHVRWDANGYRLPTEAEWEYACRAGTRAAFHTGPIAVADSECLPDPNLDQAGWHCGNSETNTHPPAGKPPNARDLYDMHGNVWEWCWDRYGPYAEEEARDPRGPATGAARILRGGSWMNAPRQARSAYRHALAPPSLFYSIGFRVAVSETDL